MDMQVLIWILAIVVLTLAEMSNIQLIAVWFIFGAVAALIAHIFKLGLLTELIVFFLTSAILLVLTRPLVKKYLNNKRISTNADRNIGKTAVVLSEINNEKGTGQVKLGGIEWTARSADNSVIPESEMVLVQSIEGVKLIVSKQNKVST